MPAERKKVIVNADAVNLEQLRPHGREHFFDRRTSWDKYLLRFSVADAVLLYRPQDAVEVAKFRCDAHEQPIFGRDLRIPTFLLSFTFACGSRDHRCDL